MAKNFSIIAYLGLKSKEFMAGLTGAKGGAKAAAGKIGAFFAKMGKAIALAGVVAMAAMTAAMVKFSMSSLQAFAEFEKGMLEVFTLMGKVGKKEMGGMQDDVLALSREMGFLSNDVVKGLYQALSAGVPPENAISFMRTAAKAAIGGVTDLETAVRALASVVNSYGKGNLSAEEAADILFTTVKLGITTFEELAASLYNVTPVAASLGVSFADVGAAMGALTAQGVPTAQAATQIRSALLSLTAPSDKARRVARWLGISFEDLTDTIKKPGGLKTAMQMVMVATGGSMAKLKALLGRIEGVNAVLGLSKGNFQAFTDAIHAQSRAAGAHVKAFDVMNAGLSRNWDLLKSNIKATMIEAGRALAPIVTQFIPTLHKLGNKFASIPWDKFGKALGAIVKKLRTALQPSIDQIIIAWEELKKALIPLIPLFQSGVGKATGFVQGALETLTAGVLFCIKAFTLIAHAVRGAMIMFKTGQKTFDDQPKWVQFLIKALGYLVKAYFLIFLPLIKVVGWMWKFVKSLKGILSWLTRVITAFIDFAASFGPAQKRLLSFSYLWEKWKDIVFKVISAVGLYFADFGKKLIRVGKSAIKALMVSWEGWKKLALIIPTLIWNKFKSIFPRLATFVETNVNKLKTYFGDFGSTVKKVLEKLWGTFKKWFPNIARFAEVTFVQFQNYFIDAYNKIVDKLNALNRFFKKMGMDVLKITKEQHVKVKKMEDDARKESVDGMKKIAFLRKMDAFKMLMNRKIAAKKAADAEKEIETEKIKAFQRALISMGINRDNVMRGTLKQLEGWMEKLGDKGKQAMATTMLQNDAQLHRMQRALVALGHDNVELTKLTGEQLRKMWKDTGQKGVNAYQTLLAHEKKLADAQLKTGADAEKMTADVRRSRKMSYQDMIKYNEALESARKEKARSDVKRQEVLAQRRKRALAEDVKRHKAAMQKKFGQVSNYLFKQGRAQFHIDGQWVKANNSQEAIEKLRAIKKLRRLGEWTDKSGKVWKFRSRVEQQSNRRAASFNRMDAVRGRKLGSNLQTQKQGITQQSFAITKLRTQLIMDDERTIHAKRYANQMVRVTTTMARGEKRHSNAVVMTRHLARYAQLYSMRLGDAADHLKEINAQIVKLPSGDVAIKIGGTTLVPIIDRLKSMDRSLVSIDHSLKGKFINQ